MVIIPFFVVWLLIAFLSYRYYNRPLPQALLGDATFHVKSKNEIKLGQYHLTYDYLPPRRMKNGIRPRRLRIQLKRTSPISLFLYPESRWDQWFEKMGFSEEVKMGIPWLDRQFHISSSDESAIRKFLADENVQSILKKFTSPEMRKIAIEPEQYCYVLQDFDPAAYENLEQIVSQFGNELAELIPYVSQYCQHSPVGKAWSLYRRHRFLEGAGPISIVIISVMGLFLGHILFYHKFEPLHGLDTYLLFIGLALVSFLVFLLLCRSAIRKRSFAVNAAQGLPIFIFIAGWAGFTFGFLFLNVSLDHSQPVKVSEQILAKWYRTQKGHSHYYIKFRSPDHEHITFDHGAIESELSHGEWEGIEPGNTIHLEIKEGFLHQKWIQSHAFGADSKWGE